MSLYHEYPLSMPSSPGFVKSSWGLKRAIAVSTSPFTGSQQVHEYDYALWQAVVTLPPMKREQAAAWQSLIIRLHGRAGTFLLGDPDAKQPMGTIQGNVTLRGEAQLGDHALELQTSVLSGTDVFKVGDYIQIDEGGSAKLHMIVETTGETNGNGVILVDVEPVIKQYTPSGTSIIWDNPRGLFRMDVSDLQWDADQVSRYGMSFSCTEAM